MTIGVTVQVYERFKDLFPEDHGFMLEVAQVESMLGSHPLTYRKDYYGGVWQVDLIGYCSTKDLRSHPRLSVYHYKIFNHAGIDWMKSNWEECIHPLFSFFAARLFLLNKPGAIPETVEERAEYWKKHYNTASGGGTVERYLDVVKHLKK